MTAHSLSVGFDVYDRACAVTDRAYRGYQQLRNNRTDTIDGRSRADHQLRAQIIVLADVLE